MIARDGTMIIADCANFALSGKERKFCAIARNSSTRDYLTPRLGLAALVSWLRRVVGHWRKIYSMGDREFDELWAQRAVAAKGRFAPVQLSGLPEPAQQYLAHDVSSGALHFMPDRLSTEVKSGPLPAIKVAHTIVWAIFAGCILAIPLVSWRGEHKTAALLTAIVFVEVITLMLNHWRCPLTSVAARYTSDRRENFDIYLPTWLAKNNQLIFGLLYFAGVLFALARWARAL